MAQVFLLNRMLSGVADHVKSAMRLAYGRAPVEVTEVAELLGKHVDVLIVGRQHIDSVTGSRRFGFEVIREAIDAARPGLVFYVLPGRFDAWDYAQDVAAVRRLASRAPLYLLEFPRLRALPERRVAREILAAVRAGGRPDPETGLRLLL
jgi:hypothetical protein